MNNEMMNNSNANTETSTQTKDKENTKIIEKENPLSKLLKILIKFLKDFVKFYGIKAAISLIQTILKQKFKKISFSKIISSLFNTGNLRTGLFLSIMPFLYNLFEFLLNRYNAESKLNTFIVGAISAYIGVLIQEDGRIMTYVIISVLTRLIHTLIASRLKALDKPTSSKKWAFIAFSIASIGFITIAFIHPTFTPISGLADTYANYRGQEKNEIGVYRAALRWV